MRDREQAIQTVLDALTFSEQDGLSLPPTYEDQRLARRIVDALLPQPEPQGGDAHAPGVQPGTVVARAGDGGESVPGQPDPLEILGEAAVELVWQARAERAEERLREVIEAARPVVETDAILRTLEPQEITRLRAVLSSLPEPAPGQKSA